MKRANLKRKHWIDAKMCEWEKCVRNPVKIDTKNSIQESTTEKYQKHESKTLTKTENSKSDEKKCKSERENT